MKKHLSFTFLSLLLVIFLAACQSDNTNNNNDNNHEQNENVNEKEKESQDNNEQNNDNESVEVDQDAASDKEAFFNQVFENRDKVESYDIQLSMIIAINTPGGIDKSNATVDGQLSEKEDEGNIIISEMKDGNTTTQHGVFYDGSQYILNGETWEDAGVEISDGEIKETGTTYYNIIEAVRDFGEYAEITEENDRYVANYSGPAKDIFYIFQEVYNLSLTGIDLETETTVDAYAVFQKDTLFMEELVLDISAESDMGRITFNISNNFADFNDTKIELPDNLKEAFDL